jgi:hypothetical protein
VGQPEENGFAERLMRTIKEDLSITSTLHRRCRAGYNSCRKRLPASFTRFGSVVTGTRRLHRRIRTMSHGRIAVPPRA